jgi:polyhydroxybutyrate depolymerase
MLIFLPSFLSSYIFFLSLLLGFSNGGFLSYRLACEGSDFIRAVGPVAAQLSGENNFLCNSSTPVPLFHTHGTSDSTISFSGGASSVARYQEIAQCSDARTVTFQNGTSTCEAATECADGSEVVFCTVTGQGHDWPGCYPNDFNYCPDRSTQDIKTTEEIWKFFSKF